MRWRAPALAAPLAWNGAASVIGQGATLLVTAILSNRLGPTEFARYAVAVSTTLTMSAVAQGGLAFTATNFVARYLGADPDKAADVARFCLRAAIAMGLLVGAVLAVLAHVVAARIYGDASLVPILLAAAVAIPFAVSSTVQTGVATGMHQFRVQALAAIVFATALVGFAVTGVLVGGAIGAAAGYGLATAARAAFLRWRLTGALRRRNPSGALAGDIARQIWPFALPAAIASLTLTPAVWATNALLAGRHGLHDLGLFSAAFTLKTLVAFVPMQLGTVFLPRYVAARGENVRTAQRELFVAVAAVIGFSGVVAIVIAMAGAPAMRMFGPDFPGGADILRWLMLSVVFECAATMWSYRLAGEMRMWTSVFAYTGPKDLILVAAAFVLVPRYGAEGLAGAHLASWLYANAALMILSLRQSSR